jgi:hypothetical protein
MVVSAIPRNKNVRLLLVRFFWILLLPVVVCWVVPPKIVTHTRPTTTPGHPTPVAWNTHGCSRNDVMIQRSANRNFGSLRMETVLVLHMGMDNNDSGDPNSNSAADDDDPERPLRSSMTTTTTTITTTDDGSRDPDSLAPESNDRRRRRRNLTINLIAAALLAVASGTTSSQLFLTSVDTPKGFRRLSPIQFILRHWVIHRPRRDHSIPGRRRRRRPRGVYGSKILVHEASGYGIIQRYWNHHRYRSPWHPRDGRSMATIGGWKRARNHHGITNISHPTRTISSNGRPESDHWFDH